MSLYTYTMSEIRGEDVPRRIMDSINEWLLHEGRLLADADELTRQLGQRIHDSGVPLWRLRLSMRTIHPLLTATTSVWEQGDAIIKPVEVEHGIETRSAYIGSPVELISQTRKSFRIPLSAELSDSDHNVLHDLKSRGGTDYYGVPLLFTDGSVAVLIFTSNLAGGFRKSDISKFQQISLVLAPIAEVFYTKRISLAVAQAYLGARTGQRVLNGHITRGHLDKINAAILISDIRDWTGLNLRTSNAMALSLANRYFEVIATAVESNGGEILKFIGDGVLAVFPLEEHATDSGTVCDRALAAANQAMQQARESEPSLELDFGIGMHFGEVLYGNIGSRTRIDFTVMGQAVNIAARIESLCSKFNRSILFSKDFADHLSEPATLISEEFLKGYDMKFKVMSTIEQE